MVILPGLRATRLRLAAAERTPGMSLPLANLRPGRVASRMPMTARMMAKIASSLLADGILKAWPRLRLDQAKKITIKIRWTMAPARLFTPTAATPALVLTPDFCRYLAFSAMPPMLAGDTRLINDEAPWAKTVSQSRIRCETAPMSATALARYVTADRAMISGTQAQSADCTACQLLGTWASLGSR